MRDAFVKPLLEWYSENARDLPWRHSTDPYRIWISEVMLQQTRVEAVKKYYRRFLEALPDIRSLASCPDDRLLKLWEGLGYYSRARNLKKAAQIICSEYNEQFPADQKELLRLPGIGSYTAGAIASISFGTKIPAVDGNVLRVYARMLCMEENILLPAVRKKAEADLERVMKILPEAGIMPPQSQEENAAGCFNQALIELGALVCVPNTAPSCGICPVKDECSAYERGMTEKLPVRIKENGRKIVKKTVLLVQTVDGTAVRKRPARGLLAGLYEFPNEDGWLTSEEVIAYIEKNGYDALRVRPLPTAKHVFSHVEWHMTGYEVRAVRSDGAGQNKDWIFAEAEQLEELYPIPAAFSAYCSHIMYVKPADRADNG